MTEEYTLPEPKPQPSIVTLKVGNRGRVTYETGARVWSVDIDADLDDGSTKPIGSYDVPQDAIYAALTDVPVPETWEEALVQFQQAVKSLAIQQALGTMQ